MSVGYVTFTRAARAEAVDRASSRFSIPPRILETSGWFRTLHSACYRILQVDAQQLLTDDAASRRWVAEAIGEPVETLCGDLQDDGSAKPCVTDADRALTIWGTARNRMVPFDRIYNEVRAVDWGLPHPDWCRRAIQKYEDAKQAEDRLDFTDLLARVAGYHFEPDGWERREPAEGVPRLAAWFFDEQQDTSKLLDAVCRRLVTTGATKWVYLAGDPFQSIYQFSGADHHCFLDYPADKTEVMGQSYRCAAPILEYGERILRECGDYFDRHIRPATHEGEIVSRDVADLADELRPQDDWLILARTNHLVSELTARLNAAGVPWRPTRGNGGWQSSKRTRAIMTLAKMQRGEPIQCADWVDVTETLPSKGRLIRGTKAHWQRVSTQTLRDYPDATPADWSMLGITDEYASKIRSGEWMADIRGAYDHVKAAERWGRDILDHSAIQVGTVHSVKGAEAENVALLTTIPQMTLRALGIPRQADAEQRVWYVGATRAKRRLVILDDMTAAHRKSLREGVET